jgi:hypothetical protein
VSKRRVRRTPISAVASRFLVPLTASFIHTPFLRHPSPCHPTLCLQSSAALCILPLSFLPASNVELHFGLRPPAARCCCALCERLAELAIDSTQTRGQTAAAAQQRETFVNIEDLRGWQYVYWTKGLRLGMCHLA